MIDINNNTVSLDLFKNVLTAIKEHSPYALDIIDSFSENQFKAKSKLIELLDDAGVINDRTEVAIFGNWYGSILVSVLSPKVKKIITVDLDDKVVRIGKNNFFKQINNVSWSTGDVFVKELNYSSTTLFINTSCEHMPSMKDWPYWNNVTSGVYFAFQSNNMDWIEGHVNCVKSLEEFKKQLPKGAEVLYEEEIDDTRGVRYTLIGKIIKS